MRPRRPEFLASTADLLSVAESIFEEWQEVGAVGHLLARNIDTGEELGFDVDTPVPLASVAKVPLALVVLDQIASGTLDPATPVTIDPATKSVGPTGLAAFRHPVTAAVGDLVHPTLTVSDNASADALFDLVGVDQVDERLREWGCAGIRIRHRMQRMYDCAAGVAGNDFGLALELAIRDDVAGQHSIETLNPAYANVGSATALVELLQRIWLDRISRPEATAELRRVMGFQVFYQRLSSDLRSDSVRVSGKTGSFLYLRHEIGVVTADSGDRVAIAVLTRSHRRASTAHDIDLAIGAAARSAFESLRA
ncbi:serine hydrolase [Streptoalloteichus hindustanus]|uniref:Beta-lactamase class A n=1 Tax=Streptoalloteichus hindustanus TaxID=2017 RepID=A0A1M5CJ94_STRHI|nr:serine hydrolase [Streptoalloteichus hindustanus]SHF54502.1 beta-lactamase class A [Streptoalloteichus hindustanus]